MPDNYNEQIQNSIELNRKALYKSYTGFISSSSPATINVYEDLGSWPSNGYIINDATGDSITVKFSKDGVTYGDAIVLNAGNQLAFDTFVVFKTMQITTGSGSFISFRVLVS